MTASISGWYLAMTASALALMVSSKWLAISRRLFGDLRRAEEVVLDPGDAVLLFHVPADVVHRAVAVQHVELGLGGVLQFGDGAVAGPLGDDAQAHLLQQDAADDQASPPML
jgi:hypothetical protein